MLNHENMLCSSCIYVCTFNFIPILLQEVVEEPVTDGDSDHKDSEGSVVDSMEACE